MKPGRDQPVEGRTLYLCSSRPGTVGGSFGRPRNVLARAQARARGLRQWYVQYGDFCTREWQD